MQKQSELLAIFVPGPDEYHAMPDMETATDMVARHNAALENEPNLMPSMPRTWRFFWKISNSACFVRCGLIL